MRILGAISAQLRQVFSWRLLVCAVIFALAQGVGVSGMFLNTVDASAIYYYIASTASGITYLTFYVLPAIPFSMSLAQDWEAHAFPYWVIRSGGGTYAFSKLLASAMAGFCTVGGGVLLFVLCTGTFSGNFGSSSGVDVVYQNLLYEGNYGLGWTLLILHEALSGATIGMLGTFFTIFFHNKFVGMAAPISFFMLITRLLSRSPIDQTSIFWPAAWFSYIHNGPSPFQVFGEKVLATIILSSLMCIVGIPHMKRRLRRA